ncbi:3754_t:CDS:2 [Gigaspora margarita]|uniref:3754_t:CDS:1 n=1 Tax=Gigaspora margarita TaxID=4874 RepID=A0ABN7W481_GIGMA|nr:3754_t:CDS:2 [Gigaspora margarita]
MDFYSTSSVENWTSNETKGSKAQEIIDSSTLKCKLGLLDTSYELLVRHLVQAGTLSLKDSYLQIDWSTISGTFATPEKNLKRPRITQKINVGSKAQINEVRHVTLVQDYIHNNEMDSIAYLQSPLKTSTRITRDTSPLMTMPNKRPLKKGVQQYSEDISVVCALGKTTSELASEIGYDYHLVDIHPKIDRKIWERKFIIYQISSIFKFYETTFFTLEFDWIESHSHSFKIRKSETNSGIVKVDAKAIRNSDGLEIWHMESGGPSDATDKHTLGDTKKTIRTDILNLIEVLRNHIDCNVQLATKLKVFCTLVIGSRMTLYSLNMLPDGRFLSVELATASIPFSFHGRHQYKAVLRMMAIFHNEITKQEELMGEINKSVIRSEKTTVRDAFKIPEGIFEK